MRTLVEHFRLMARNNAWANHRLLTSCTRLSRDAFLAKRTSFFPSIEATLNHILAVDRYYIDALEEGGLGPKAFYDHVPLDDAAALLSAQAESDRQLIALCDRLSDADMEREVVTDRGSAGLLKERIAELLAHLFQHQIHHRGQAHAMLAGTAEKPPQLDEFFLRFDREARAGDLAILGLSGPEAGG